MAKSKKTSFKSKWKRDKNFRRTFLFFTGVIVAIVLLVLASKHLIVATVNGTPITRHQVITELEKQGGASTVESLVVKTLILGEANKLGINIEDSVIDLEIALLEEQVSAQGLTLEAALEMQGVNLEDLRENIRVQKMIEEIFKGKVEITDEEVVQYFESNSELFGEEAVFGEVDEDIRSQLLQQKLSSEYQTWISELQKNATVKYFVIY